MKAEDLPMLFSMSEEEELEAEEELRARREQNKKRLLLQLNRGKQLESQNHAR